VEFGYIKMKISLFLKNGFEKFEKYFALNGINIVYYYRVNNKYKMNTVCV